MLRTGITSTARAVCVINRRMASYQNTQHVEITNTLHRVLFAMDSNDHELFASSFTEDGVCEVKKSGLIVKGRSDLKNFCNTIHLKFKPALHIESNVIVNIRSENNAARATTKSYWYAILGGDIISTGFHHDELVPSSNDDGHETWKLQHRIIEHHWTKSGGFEEK